ncbi:MAG: hypothetical protein ACLGIC_03630 [Acidimicrobiia bacterium]
MTATATRPAAAGASDRTPLVAGGCVALALLSLAVPATLGYDPWAWLVWGREILAGDLDTTGGPSWKPLPIALTAPLAPLGDLAVPLYTVVARALALAAVAAVARLAWRFGGGLAAALAVALLVLTPDGDPRFLRLVLEGHEAPWSAGLAVAALVAVLDRRPGRALAWTWSLALLRPEAWPFLLLAAAWAAGVTVPGARRSARSWSPRPPARRSARWAVAALVSIPLLWFVPDWIGSGSPFHGAGTAQVLADRSIASRLVDSLATAAGMVPVVAWVLAGVAVAATWRRGDRGPAVLAAAAAAWSVLVVAMAAAFGYAAISRFFLPAAAVLVALAGAGASEALRAARGWDRGRVLAAAVGATVLVALSVPRVVGIGAVADEVADRGALADDLDEVIEQAGGADVLASCDAAVVTARTLLRSAAAWHLGLPLDAVERSVLGQPAVLLLESARAARLARADPAAIELAELGRWTVFAHRCPPAAGR